ncbi:hypothetical protein [Roseibium algae]|uniref:Uncharacterized protein n=1 Tax=Roseibium algae TaxID=3123038 RepID=A0ABU8TKS0_9HYPH
MDEALKRGAADAVETPAVTPTQALKSLLEGYIKTSNLQSDYQVLHQTLPSVLGLAGEILKKKEEGDSAFAQGQDVVEKLLADASSTADKLSKAYADQHATLSNILADSDLLSEILKAGKEVSGAGLGIAPGAAGNSAADKPSVFRPGLPGLADGQLVNQLNTVMGNIQTMISQEVQKQTAQISAQMMAAAPQNQPPQNNRSR